MPPEIVAFASGFPVALAHTAIALAFLAVGCAAHAYLSPYKEIERIGEGNPAAAISFAGVMTGLALPLAAALAASSSALQVAIWCGATLVVQLLVFRVIDMLLAGLPVRIVEGEAAAAWLLVAAKVAAALVFAAALLG
jgi:putative membrane protein